MRGRFRTAVPSLAITLEAGGGRVGPSGVAEEPATDVDLVALTPVPKRIFVMREPGRREALRMRMAARRQTTRTVRLRVALSGWGLGRELVALLGGVSIGRRVYSSPGMAPLVSFINKGSRQGRSCLYLSGSPDPDEIHQSPHATVHLYS